ncbi:MAG: lipoyl(octanoyl) transferase LipB [Rhodothermales bacterium]
MTRPSQPAPQPVTVCYLGRVAYVPTWDLQKQVQARLIAAKRQTVVLPHVMLLVEHPPVYTLGKSGDASNLLLPEESLAHHGARFYDVDRGGDITFHGPGQLVGYPLLDLESFFTDIHRYMRVLEEVVIGTCAEYGVPAGRVAGRTGVWIGPDAKGPERKICALGIRCSRWVTMHGFAFNLNTDLSFFDHIIPCGIPDRDVTSLARERAHPVDEADVRARLIRHFADRFGAQTTYLEHEAAFAYLQDLLHVKELRVLKYARFDLS